MRLEQIVSQLGRPERPIEVRVSRGAPEPRTKKRDEQRRSTRSDWEGHHRIGPLPPGQYLLVAVDDFEETEIYERETLDQISPKAVRVALNAGEMRAQDLRADAPSDTDPTRSPGTSGGAAARVPAGGGRDEAGARTRLAAAFVAGCSIVHRALRRRVRSSQVEW